jgi:hypothetical protein
MDDLVAPKSNVLENDKLPSAFEVRRRARDALNDWLKVRSMGAQQQSATLKCNIDVACFMNANKFCIGACIRDVNGGLDSSFIC